MLQTLLSRVLASAGSPTADLYFRNACGDFLGGQVEQIAPTVFASQDACLVMRHDLQVGRLPQRRRLIYLIDDDVEAGLVDENLPYLYRQKLRIVDAPAARRLRRFAGVAVVTSQALAELYSPFMHTRLLTPYWSEDMGGTDHFRSLDAGWQDAEGAPFALAPRKSRPG